jgi:hypothetical protein
LLGACEDFTSPAGVPADVDDACVVAHGWFVEFDVCCIRCRVYILRPVSTSVLSGGTTLSWRKGDAVIKPSMLWLFTFLQSLRLNGIVRLVAFSLRQ